MSTNPVVSVIIPAYQEERYLGDAIRSVLAQTFQPFELLIVDDGSQDQTSQVAQSFQDSRIRLLNHDKNLGLSMARNTGVHHSKGDFLAFLDADDIWLPQMLARHISFLSQNPPVGLCFNRSFFMSAAGERYDLFQTFHHGPIDAETLFAKNLAGNGSSNMVRRWALEDLLAVGRKQGIDSIFDPALKFSDWECWFRLICLTPWKAEGIPEVLTGYRMHPFSISCREGRHPEHFQRALDKMIQYAPEVVKRQQKAGFAHFYLGQARNRLFFGKKTEPFRYLLCAYRSDPRVFRGLQWLLWTAACLKCIIPSFVFPYILKLGIKISRFLFR